jgi:DNA-binding GntR family transcriptional regulator
MKAKATPSDETSLAEQVYQRLLEKLFTRQWGPGDLLNRRAVAAELKVSTGPVLEAMLRLEDEGFLEAIPRRGTLVRKVDLAALRDQLIVREALECQAARMYASKLEPVRAELEKVAARLDASPVGGLESAELEIRFHRLLVRSAGSAGLLRAFDRVSRLGLFFNVSALSPMGAPPTRSSHVDFLKKLMKATTPDAGERLMREHLYAGKEQIFYSAEGA